MRAQTLMRSVSSVALIVAGGQQAYADGGLSTIRLYTRC